MFCCKGISFRVADRAGQTQLQQHSLFFFAHTHSFQTAVFVVVTQQMQHGVNSQKSHLPLQRMPMLMTIAPSIMQPLFSSISYLPSSPRGKLSTSVGMGLLRY